MSAAEQTDRLCEVMHDAYEEAAAKAGWETQERSRKPWAEVPEANKVAMRHAVHALMGHLLLNEGMRPPAEKGDHEIVWYLDGDTVRGDAVCNLPPGSDCRLMCPHGCESWTAFGRDKKGPYHLFYDTEIDGDGRHEMVPMTGDECNVSLFLNEDYGYIAEQHDSRDRFEVGRVTIVPQWETDHYTYKVATGGTA